ncbi:MAG: XRE family transcriptional regulator [Alphaproteobacteria bacterium]|nr:XRE family transcriptional regulator [Alphaproteobacteria bacterium]
MTNGTDSNLSRRLREIRKQNRWTLREVSSRTGLATSTLSKVENNQTSLTYDNLVRLAEGLGIDIAELFADAHTPPVTGRRTITLKGQEHTERTPNYDYHYHCADLRRMRMVPIVVDIKARSVDEFGELLRHSGEEFIYVLDGAIEVHTEFYEPVRLEAGESIYLDSTMAHAYIAVGRGNARVLGVCSGIDPDQAADFASLRAGGGRGAAGRARRR